MSNAGWTFHKAVKYWASSLDPTWQKVLKGIDSLQSNNMIGFCLSFGSGDWLSTLRLLCWLPAAVSEPWRALRPTQTVTMAEKKGEWGPPREWWWLSRKVRQVDKPAYLAIVSDCLFWFWFWFWFSICLTGYEKNGETVTLSREKSFDRNWKISATW